MTSELHGWIWEELLEKVAKGEISEENKYGGLSRKKKSKKNFQKNFPKKTQKNFWNSNNIFEGI